MGSVVKCRQGVGYHRLTKAKHSGNTLREVCEHSTLAPETDSVHMLQGLPKTVVCHLSLGARNQGFDDGPSFVIQQMHLHKQHHSWHEC